MGSKQPPDGPERGSAGGSPFCGDVTARDSNLVGGDLHLTVQGVTDANLDELAERILAALRADAPVVIAGGAGGTTVLLADGEPQVVASHRQGTALAQRAGDVESYLAGLVMHRDFGPWDTRYVPLERAASRLVTPEDWAGYIPVDLCALCPRGEGPGQRIERVTIPSIAAAVEEYPRFVLLGEPGAGKTTELRRIALDAARARARDDAAPVPLFIRLAHHRRDESPVDFVARLWRASLGADLEEALRAGRVFLILDALNEMGRAGYADRVTAWRDFARHWHGVRMAFSCRTLDYKNSLGLQRVEIRRLDDGRIQGFLRRCVPAHAEALWEDLDRHRMGLLDLVRNPFLLAAVAWVYTESPETGLPSNRGQLLARLAEKLLEREKLWHSHPQWIEAPALEGAISSLAWALQESGEGASLTLGDALRWLPQQVAVDGREIETPAETVVSLGCAATLLDEIEGQVRFCHHLVQEYFAARELLRRFDDGEDLRSLWKAPWWKREMPALQGQGEWDPLLSPPTTGWEETTIVAAGLTTDPTTLVEAVRVVNPILAGRCLDEGRAAVPGNLHERIQGDLLDGMQDRRVHLRARIAAGHALGRLGDSRFEGAERGGVRFVAPPLVQVPAGVYPIGSSRRDRQAFDDERPRHHVQVERFQISRYPVTVGEYRCFVEAGGYEKEQYWKTEDARAWLEGEDPSGGPVGRLLGLRQKLLDSGRPLEDWAREQSWKPQTLQSWQTWTSMSETEARQAILSLFIQHSREEPAWWDDAALTGINQPVVGVTWYEARAYCAWLAEVTGRLFRLPTEVEWEAAMRGRDGRRYPWGQRFYSARANTFEGRVLGTTPVGVYSGGVSPLGVWDGAGNVWEWTSSLSRPYPYRVDDGRENDTSVERRVLRGGSWYSLKRYCRCAFRDVTPPDLFSHYVGFRVVSPGSPLSDS